MANKKILTTKVLPVQKHEEEELPNPDVEKEEEKVITLPTPFNIPCKSCLNKHCDGLMLLEKKNKYEEVWKCQKCLRKLAVM